MRGQRRGNQRSWPSRERPRLRRPPARRQGADSGQACRGRLRLEVSRRRRRAGRERRAGPGPGVSRRGGHGCARRRGAPRSGHEDQSMDPASLHAGLLPRRERRPQQCAFCRLRHEKPLDAAHIVPDSQSEGELAVRSGMALRKLHHAAFDGLFIGVTPDHVIRVRRDLLGERDGPMLRHGLKGMHGHRIWLPRHPEDRPARELLERRFEEFRAAM